MFLPEPPSGYGVDEVYPLVEAAVASDVAFARLWTLIEPTLWEMVDRPRFASHLAHTEESRTRIVAAVHDQLPASLPHYLDARRTNPRLPFWRWLNTVSKRIAISYDSYVSLTATRRRSARRLLV